VLRALANCGPAVTLAVVELAALAHPLRARGRAGKGLVRIEEKNSARASVAAKNCRRDLPRHGPRSSGCSGSTALCGTMVVSAIAVAMSGRESRTAASARGRCAVDVVTVNAAAVLLEGSSVRLTGCRRFVGVGACRLNWSMVSRMASKSRRRRLGAPEEAGCRGPSGRRRGWFVAALLIGSENMISLCIPLNRPASSMKRVAMEVDSTPDGGGFGWESPCPSAGCGTNETQPSRSGCIQIH